MAEKVTIIPPRRKGAKTQSLRSLLNDMAAYRAAVDRGEIGSADGQRRCAMVAAHAEIILMAKQLEMVGVDPVIDATPEAGYAPPQIAPHRVKKVTVKRGQDKLGQPIDEKVVSITSSTAGDDGLELATEMEALT